MASWHKDVPHEDSALDALERARKAQEKHDKRIDVQLRLSLDDKQERFEKDFPPIKEDSK